MAASPREKRRRSPISRGGNTNRAPITVTIRNKRYRIEFAQLEDCRGSCDPLTQTAKTIWIDSRLTGEELVEVAIHEAIHAACWDLDETAVMESARDIARMLTRLGLLKNED